MAYGSKYSPFTGPSELRLSSAVNEQDLAGVQWKLIVMVLVLIADADPHDQRDMQLVLQDAWYDVIVCSDGNDALEHLLSRPIDLVIADIFLPNKSGLELLEELQSWRRSVPVIAVSAIRSLQLGANSKNQIDFLREAEALGARLTIQKPFSTAQLLKAVSQCTRFH